MARLPAAYGLRRPRCDGLCCELLPVVLIEYDSRYARGEPTSAPLRRLVEVSHDRPDLSAERDRFRLRVGLNVGGWTLPVATDLSAEASDRARRQRAVKWREVIADDEPPTCVPDRHDRDGALGAPLP